MRVIELPAGEDLAAFSRFLWQHRVAHRIFEERGQQIVELADPAMAAEVRKAFSAWRAGSLDLQSAVPGTSSQPRQSSRVMQSLRACPGVAAVVLVSLVVFPFALALSEGQPGWLVLALTIVDLRVHPDVDLNVLVSDLQIWRWLTPVFLHFSVTHIAFNSVVTFDLLVCGRSIESIGLPLMVNSSRRILCDA
jgi:GlpG protein